MKLKVLQTVASIARATGGPAYSVTSLCTHLGNAGTQMNLLFIGHTGKRSEWIEPESSVVDLFCARGCHIPVLNVCFSPDFSTKISKLHDEVGLQIIHDHGLWLPNNYASAKFAKKLGIPLVVSTRGMLEPWALQYRGWKKKIMWKLWVKQALQSAAVLHATAQEEADSLRALGLTNPIAVIPNGVELPADDFKPSQNVEKKAVFISRIHPKKGLLNLVKAWAAVQPIGWKMIIAGPSEEDHVIEVKNSVKELGLQGQFEFPGLVHGDDKLDLYRRADLFVLPTFSENFGIVVAEALASKVPVITTIGTPWRELQSHKCGWWIDIGVEPLAKALGAAIALSDSERHEMGLRGRQLVKDQYVWPKIADDMSKVYQWALGGGDPPSCVRLD